MGHFSVSIDDALAKLRAQRDALTMVAAPLNNFDWTRRGDAGAPSAVRTLSERYGNDITEATVSPATGRDFIFLGIIDWHYRVQRPQHLAMNLADLGHRVIYVSVAFEPADSSGRFVILESPHPGVFEVRLRLANQVPHSIYRGFTKSQTDDISHALEELQLVLGIRAPIVTIQYPSWYPAAKRIPGATVVYDCLDYLAGFNNVPQPMVDLEDDLIRNADIVVSASKPLSDILASRRTSSIIRNASDVDYFAQGVERESAASPVIGYFGAVAEWFEIDWIAHSARAHPEWQFRIIGQIVADGVREAAALPNVEFLGEQPYSTLPGHLSHFDVAVIPFKLSKLVECVNPVKLYEYMAQGKPVVSSALPEVVDATDLTYIANDAEHFERQIERALANDNDDLRAQRKAWASAHTWAERAGQFSDIVDRATPLVSVIVLSYNNVSLTRACIHSVLALSDYPNLEIIVVDNASTDGSVEYLIALEKREPLVKTLLSETNVGFAAGNNLGLRAATGDYLIVLNNDTHVTRGWVRDLIRPLALDPSIGLVGPLTNNIGNEQKTTLQYETMGEMAKVSRAFVEPRARERMAVACVAFFCAAMRRDVFDAVGLLDESYGRGFFEDDDYCRRVAEAGYGVAIADDVFVHHELSASFSKVSSAERKALMERNRDIFEARWGTWIPHRYRDEPGFGAS